MEKELQIMFEDVLAMYGRGITTLHRMEAKLRKDKANKEGNTDIGFALNEINKYVVDLGKEVRRVLNLAELLVCSQWVQQQDDEPVRTEYCTASPRVKISPHIPSRDSQEYAQLCEWLGLPASARELVRIHQPTLGDLITQRTENSKALPPGLGPDKTYTEFHLTFRKRKEVSDYAEDKQSKPRTRKY